MSAFPNSGRSDRFKLCKSKGSFRPEADMKEMLRVDGFNHSTHKVFKFNGRGYSKLWLWCRKSIEPVQRFTVDAFPRSVMAGSLDHDQVFGRTPQQLVERFYRSL